MSARSDLLNFSTDFKEYADQLPKLVSWDLTKTAGAWSASYKYNVQENPVFIKLPILMDFPVFVSPYPTSQEPTAPVVKKPVWVQIQESLYKPTASYVMSTIAFLNVFSMIKTMKHFQASVSTEISISHDTAPDTFRKFSYQQWIVAGASILYALPPLLSLTQLKIIQYLHTVFNEIETSLLKQDLASADKKFKNLSLIHKIILKRKALKTIDIRWRYHYLDGQLGLKWKLYQRAENACLKALELCNTNDKKYLIIKNLLTIYIALKENCQNPALYNEYESMLKKYKSQIPSDSTLYQMMGQRLSKALLECSSSLKGNKFESALQIFNNIEWDDFYDYAYPDVTLGYIQFKIVLTLAGQLYRGLDKLDPISRFNIVKRDLEKMHSLLQSNPRAITFDKGSLELFNRFIISCSNAETKELVEHSRTLTPQADHMIKVSAGSAASPTAATLNTKILKKAR